MLAEQSSRERSPRRTDVASAVSPYTDQVTDPSFAIDQAVVASSLMSHPELVGSRAAVVSFDQQSGRYAIRLDATGESIRIKGCSIKPNIFAPVLQ